MRLGVLSALYGLAAGVVAAIVVWVMGLVSRLVWAGPEARWYAFAVVLCGGALIALLRHWHAGVDLAAQVDDARNAPSNNALSHKRRNALLMAAMAVVAVGFGGAIGPEAGILAVVGELTALIGLRLARDNAEARLLGEAGAAGALGGLYGSPPGAALIAQEHPEAPRWQIYVAALTGLLGFLLTASCFLPEQPMHIALPAHTPARNGTDMLWAVAPALLGAAVGLAFAVLLPRVQALVARSGGVVRQTLVGTLCFALLVAALPVLRFSGHHEMEAMLHWGRDAGMGALLGLALLKVGAMALCLAAGWRGGAAFPLLFAGAAAGGAALWLLPATPPAVALVAGMAAALTVGLGKPLVAAAIALLLLGTTATGPLCVGLALGWAASKLAPPSSLH